MIKIQSYLFYSAFLLFIYGCRSESENDLVEQGVNFQHDLNETCHCDSLIEKDNKYYINDNQIYTGTCFSFYPNSEEKYIEKQILNGKIHGKIFYYDKTGNVILEELYNEGEKEINFKNEFITINCNEIKMKKDEFLNVTKHYYKGKLFSGLCQDFYPTINQIYIESNYKDGLLDGYTNYYKKDGSLFIMQVFEKGVLVKETYY